MVSGVGEGRALGHGPESGRAGVFRRNSAQRRGPAARGLPAPRGKRGRCWWWAGPPPLGVLVVVQGVGITAGHLPGLSVRRIADLAPGSARADAKDAVVIAGAARTLPHTLRSVSTSDEDAAALSMLTGFDPDLARQVNQSEGRIRGQWFTQTSPLSGSGPGGGGGAVVGRTTPHAPSGPMSSPESRPWHQAHPHVPGPDHPCSGSGPDRRRPCWPRPRGKTSTTGAQPASRIRPGAGDQEIGLIDPRQGTSPTKATSAPSPPCSPPPRCAPTPFPGPTTSANATKAKRLGPGRPRPGPPPHPDPARHDPQRHPPRPATSHKTTHRRPTHHTGAPPPPGPGRRQQEASTCT